MYVERTFTVPRPVETVFDYLSDFTHTNEWDPGTVKTTRTSGDGGVGTTYANTSEFAGRKVDLTYETITFERPGKVQFRGTNKQATTMDTMAFTPASDGTATEIHYRADFDFGTLINLVAPILVKPKLNKLADATVAKIQESVRKLAI